MSIISRIKSIFVKKETQKKQELKPEVQAPIRSVDVGTSTQTRTGGYTVSGGSGSRGGGGSIVKTSGNITPPQAEMIEKQTAGLGTPATLTPTPSANTSVQQLSQSKAPSLKTSQEQKKPLTEEEKRMMVSERANRLRKLDFTSSDFVARTKSGGISVPGTFATTLLTTSETLSAQLRLDKFFPNSPMVDRGKTIKFISDTSTFSFFSPAMATTAQIEKTFTPTRIKFTGINEVKESPTITKTTLGFTTSSGKKGIARAVSYSSMEGENQISRTLVGGGTFKRGLNIPKGIRTEPTSTFGAKVIGITKSNKEFVKTAEMGGVKSFTETPVENTIFYGQSFTKNPLTFKTEKIVGIGKSKPYGEYSISSSKAISESGKESFSSGIVKSISSDKGMTEMVTSEGTTLSRGFGGGSQTQNILKNVVKQSVIQEPKTSFSGGITGMTSGFSVGSNSISRTQQVSQPQSFRPITTQQVSQPQPTVKNNELLIPASAFNTNQEIKINQDTKLLYNLKPKQKTRSSPRTMEIQTPTQTPVPRLTTPTISTSVSRLTPKPKGLSTITPTSINLPPFAIAPLPFGGERFGGLGKIKATRTYKYTPSFGALVYGIKGKAPTKTRFTGLELRPIVSSKKKKKKGGFFELWNVKKMNK